MEWPTQSDAYELVGKIGQGAFASVWKACLKQAGSSEAASAPNPDSAKASDNANVNANVNANEQPRECAIKVLNLDHVDSNLSEIRLEVQAMRLSSHPNILTCHTAFVHSTDLWLVTQLMRKGSSLHCLQGARRHLRKHRKSIAFEQHILYILHQTLLGLKYIHENGQIHRDIKAGNILLDGNGDVRIADFGVSGWLINAGTQQEKAKTFVGTPCWMAPEVMEQVHGYDYKADIWSLGITALELAKGYAPYAKYPPMKVLILTIQEDPPSLDTYDEEHGDEDDADDDNNYGDGIAPEVWSESFRQLVDLCLQKNPGKRPGSSELLQSKHLNSLSDDAVRQSKREALHTMVCDLAEDVGTAQHHGSTKPSAIRNPGESPVSIFLSKEENRPAGTTWVFADGSQVLASDGAAAASVDDVMEQLDQFGLETGGENYNKQPKDDEAAQQAASPPPPPQQTAETNSAADDSDDLDAFMDEFEMHTQGENFQHPSRAASE